jgi:hypothetical protein
VGGSLSTSLWQFPDYEFLDFSSRVIAVASLLKVFGGILACDRTARTPRVGFSREDRRSNLLRR